jgi:hypothetical protein
MEAAAVSAAPVPRSVTIFLASRKMRLHHYLWHGVRDGWLTTFGDQTKRAFRASGWEPPRPSLRLDDDGRRQVIVDNNSGEDFSICTAR